MQLVSTSIHAADIYARDSERAELARYVDRFLENNEITVLEIRTTPPPNRETFNRAITVVPSKQLAVSADREIVDSMVRELAFIEIEGVRIARSAYEIGKLMREKGYKLRAQSVKRVAKSIGIELRM